MYNLEIAWRWGWFVHNSPYCRNGMPVNVTYSCQKFQNLEVNVAVFTNATLYFPHSTKSPRRIRRVRWHGSYSCEPLWRSSNFYFLAITAEGLGARTLLSLGRLRDQFQIAWLRVAVERSRSGVVHERVLRHCGEVSPRVSKRKSQWAHTFLFFPRFDYTDVLHSWDPQCAPKCHHDLDTEIWSGQRTCHVKVPWNCSRVIWFLSLLL